MTYAGKMPMYGRQRCKLCYRDEVNITLNDGDVVNVMRQYHLSTAEHRTMRRPPSLCDPIEPIRHPESLSRSSADILQYYMRHTAHTVARCGFSANLIQNPISEVELIIASNR